MLIIGIIQLLMLEKTISKIEKNGMFSFFRSLISPPSLYIKIRKNWLSIRDVRAGNELGDVTTIAIKSANGKETISAIGKMAETEYRMNRGNTIIANGYDHPRLIVHNLKVAEITLRLFVGEVLKNKMISLTPIVIMHVTEKLEGGITDTEVKVLRELATNAGARAVYVWNGRELTDNEILEGRYPGNYWLSDPPKK